MTDYNNIRKICRYEQTFTRSVIDEFLIYYAAHQERLDRKADKKLAEYRHVSKEFPVEWLNMFKTQYIAHRIFKKGGLIRKYMKHLGFGHLSDEGMEFLRDQNNHPWRFSFAEIGDRPADDFFNMTDAFAGGSYLLYSPSMAGILDDQQVSLWLNLITFNGSCYQSYGPIGAFSGFQPPDIHFFASQLNPRIRFDDGPEILENVEHNPVPYMMLISGANLPLTINKEDQVVEIVAKYLDDAFDTADFQNHFKTEYNKGVYKLSQKEWDEFPHFNTVYYDEKEQLLYLYSMTDRGFGQLVKRLNSYGYNLSHEPDFRINMSMKGTAEKILKKKISLTGFDSMFTRDTPAEDKNELDKMNMFLSKLIPYVNSGEKPDIEAMAEEAGVPAETALEIYEQLLKKMG